MRMPLVLAVFALLLCAAPSFARDVSAASAIDNGPMDDMRKADPSEKVTSVSTDKSGTDMGATASPENKNPPSAPDKNAAKNQAPRGKVQTPPPDDED